MSSAFPVPDHGARFRPARLSVGVISTGRVGTAVGAALERAGHVVSAVVARSDQSRQRAAERLPEARRAEPAEVAAGVELLVLAVPDPVLPGLVRELVDTGALRAGHIVVHTSGALGWTVLRPVHERGAVVAATHPAMTFSGTRDDDARLAGCAWGVTAPDEVGLTVAQNLVVETGGRPVTVDESRRGLYHAALAHGANHLVTLVADASESLRAALTTQAAPATVPGADGMLAVDPDELVEPVLRPLLEAALDRALRGGGDALTGPVMRGDAATVSRHLDVLESYDDGLAAGYRAMALRTAQRVHAHPELMDLLAPDLQEPPR